MRNVGIDILKALLYCLIIIVLIFLSMNHSSNFIYTDF